MDRTEDRVEIVETEYAGDARLVVPLTVVFFSGLALVLALPLFSHASWLVFVQDDLLYYLKVAQNIAHGQGSTFNGIARTNGYQPLWLLVLIGLSWFTTHSQVILGFIAATNFVAAVATFLLASRLLRISGAHPLLVFVLAAWTTLYSVTLFFYGMEVTLTVPIVLGVLCLLANLSWITHHGSRAFLFGLLLSAMVLSRIDTLILGGLLLGGILLTPVLRRMIRSDLLLGVGLGLLPVVVYFALNHVLFGTWLPISGMAKELKRDHLPSIEPWRVFFHPLAGAFTFVILCGSALFLAVRRQLSPMLRIAFPATLLFPFVYYMILSCVSDWTLWGWYMYPIRTAICVSFVIFCLWAPGRRMLERPLVVWMLVASVFGCLALLRWTRQQTDIYAASVEIQQFAASHAGVYAMGDRAGRVAYLIPNPIVQTEGLMMDREYLGYVARQTPLRKTLAHYGVRYYVATAYEPFTGCFEAQEPAKGGPKSAKMRAEFCEKPVASFLHDGVETMIFELGAR